MSKLKNKKVAILQSNYIPWKGYFDMINTVDEFIFYDEMQYTKNDWRNRNKIKTANGVRWLTIAVDSKNRMTDKLKIKDIKVSNNEWNQIHWNSIKSSYSDCRFFNDYKDVFEELYLDCEDVFLSQINCRFIKGINEIIGIKTKLSLSSDYGIIEGKTERLIDLCKKTGASEYISGPAAKDYIDADLFKENNIKLIWMDYSGYTEYTQQYSPFEHGVSIIDLIFNEGPNAQKFMKSFNSN